MTNELNTPANPRLTPAGLAPERAAEPRSWTGPGAASRTPRLPAGSRRGPRSWPSCTSPARRLAFVLHGNTHDYLRIGDDDAARYGTLAEFLAEQLFGRW